MQTWRINYWDNGSGKSPLEKWLDTLSKDQLKSIAKELTILQKVGNELKLPHSRALGKGLFDLQENR